jgi:hypothetical protein
MYITAVCTKYDAATRPRAQSVARMTTPPSNDVTLGLEFVLKSLF